MPATTAATQPASRPLREDVVYYSFTVPAHVAQLFSSDRRADSRLGEVEEACRCSILVNAKRHPQEQQPLHFGSRAPTAGASAAGEVTVEVLMDEIGASFAGSVRHLSDLVRSLGAHLRVRRIIKKLSLANGSKQYRVEQQPPQQQPPQLQPPPQQPPQQQPPQQQPPQQQPPTQQLQRKPRKLSKQQPASGSPADLRSPDSGRQGDLTASPLNSVVLSFADESDGHWSLFSMVSPFLELDRPSELTHDLWIHAVRLLADCTRSMVTEAAAGELIVFSKYSKSVQDASYGEVASSDCSMEGSLITALLCDPGTAEDAIENFVCCANNNSGMQVMFTNELDNEHLTPSFSEPLLMLKSTESHPEFQRAASRWHTQPAICARQTDSATHVLTTGHHRTSGQLLSVAACSCEPHGLSLVTGSLGQALKCPGQLRCPTRLGQAACSAAQLACLGHSDDRLALADGQRLATAEITCHATDQATQLWSPQRNVAGSAAPRCQLSGLTDAPAVGCVALTAASAPGSESPALAQRMAQGNWRGATGGSTSQLGFLPDPPGRHPDPGVRLSPESGACEQCIAGATAYHQAKATDVRARANCRDVTPVQGCCQKGSHATNRAVGLPRLLAADVEAAARANGCPDVGVRHSHAFASTAESAKAPLEASMLPASCERHRCSADRPMRAVIQPIADNAPAAELGRPLTCDNPSRSGCAHLQVAAGSLQPCNADVDGALCPLAASSTTDGIARDDCWLASASLAPTLTARQRPDSVASSSTMADGIRAGSHQRLMTSALDAGCHEFAPICTRSYQLSGFESTPGVRGVSCEVLRGLGMSSGGEVGRSAAHCTLRLSPLTEVTECAAAGSLRRRCHLETQLERAAAFHRTRHDPSCECVTVDCGSAGQLDATVPPELLGALPLTELHNHCCQGGGTAAGCALLSLDKRRASASRQRSVEVSETIITLRAPHCCDACQELVSGLATRCNHGQEAVCQISHFQRHTGLPLLLPADSWQQLANLVADTVIALEWAVAWPAMRQDLAASASVSDAAATEALVSRYGHPSDTVVVACSELTLYSELVWESRRRVQLTQSMLN